MNMDYMNRFYICNMIKYIIFTYTYDTTALYELCCVYMYMCVYIHICINVYLVSEKRIIWWKNKLAKNVSKGPVISTRYKQYRKNKHKRKCIFMRKTLHWKQKQSGKEAKKPQSLYWKNSHNMRTTCQK